MWWAAGRHGSTIFAVKGLPCLLEVATSAVVACAAAQKPHSQATPLHHHTMHSRLALAQSSRYAPLLPRSSGDVAA